MLERVRLETPYDSGVRGTLAERQRWRHNWQKADRRGAWGSAGILRFIGKLALDGTFVASIQRREIAGFRRFSVSNCNKVFIMNFLNSLFGLKAPARHFVISCALFLTGLIAVSCCSNQARAGWGSTLANGCDTNCASPPGLFSS